MRLFDAAQACGPSWPRTWRRSSASPTPTKDSCRLMLRLAALREREMKQVDAAIEGYRQVLERDPDEPAGARARSNGSPQDPAYSLAIAEILEPLYRAQERATSKLIGVYEVQVVARGRPEPQGRAPASRSRSLYEDAAGNVNAARSTPWRARSPSIQRATATQRELDRLARATGRFQDLARVFEQLAVQPARGRARRVSSTRPRLACSRTIVREPGARDRALPQGAQHRPDQPGRSRGAAGTVPGSAGATRTCR